MLREKAGFIRVFSLAVVVLFMAFMLSSFSVADFVSESVPANDTFQIEDSPGIQVGQDVIFSNDLFSINYPIIAINVSSPKNGILDYFNSNGEFVYLANACFYGVDSFDYALTDGENISSSATITIEVTRTTNCTQIENITGDFRISSSETVDNVSQAEVVSDIWINVTSDGKNQVFLPAGTIIKEFNSSLFNLSLVSFSEINFSSLTGFNANTLAKGALQFGIPSMHLSFSSPITIRIFVGTDYDNQTLDVRRSTTGSDWTQDGLVDKTCYVSSGICEFKTNEASYFSATKTTIPAPPTPETPNMGSSSGGACTTSWTCSNWTSCVNGSETRTCSYPANYCKPTSLKPNETQSCIIEAPVNQTNVTNQSNVIVRFIENTAEAIKGVRAGITGAVIGGSAKSMIIAAVIVIVLIILYAWVTFKIKSKAMKAKGKK
jgi:hypothetical protein